MVAGREEFAQTRAATAARVDPWLVGILLIALALDLFQLDWGLPHGNYSWAADAAGPITVLGIVQHSFSRWNSGWFWFKYPLGYPFELAASFLPYVAYLYLTGAWRHPRPEYPYGFADPERALYVMAMCGRLLSVAFALGVVACAYGIGRRLYGRAAARLGAFLVATAYPIVYYAHTTNLDIGYLFWLVLALYCAIVASETERLLPWLVLGVAASMALSCKEQGFAFLLPLPFLVVGAHAWRRRTWRVCLERPALVMGGAAIATLIVANNILFNPMGFVGRIAYLLGHPLKPVSARLAPVEFALWKGAKEWRYLRELWTALGSGLGVPLAVLGIAGAASLTLRRPAVARWVIVPAAVFYYLALRGLDLITLRYTLPLMVLLAVTAAGLLAQAFAAARGRQARTAVAVAALSLCSLALARAVDLHWLMAADSRYRAEAWMAANLPPGSRIETYQKAVYLPRFGDGLKADLIPMQERSVDGVRRRRPRAIVLSSASASSITHVWSPDWRVTGTLLSPVPGAVELIDALARGELPYRAAAVFRQQPRLIRLRITSLAPTITIYERNNE